MISTATAIFSRSTLPCRCRVPAAVVRHSASGPYAQLIPAGTFGSNPVISWPLASGEYYLVQFKTNLTDSVWLNLPGNRGFYRRHRLLRRPLARARPKILPHRFDSLMIMKTADKLVIEKNAAGGFTLVELAGCYCNRCPSGGAAAARARRDQAKHAVLAVHGKSAPVDSGLADVRPG